jgi:hypothetical protein
MNASSMPKLSPLNAIEKRSKEEKPSKQKKSHRRSVDLKVFESRVKEEARIAVSKNSVSMDHNLLLQSIAEKVSSWVSSVVLFSPSQMPKLYVKWWTCAQYVCQIAG